ncbi:MAG: hypothetical protein RL266_684, partial [Bacteroidota bacterium]
QVIATTNAWYAVGVGDEFDATVISDFTASITSNCEAPVTVNFNNFSTNGETYTWDFGDGGTSTALNPSHTYAANGVYTVSLSVDGGNCGTDDLVVANYISIDPNNPCVALMPDDGSQTLNWCTGTLYDDGGPNGNYQDDNSVVTTISPPGATSITLNFSSFSFEEGYDYLFVYDGPSTGSPLIGQYDGNGLPNGGSITSTGGAITLRQSSDIYLNESGFALTWQCIQPNSPPTADFSSSLTTTCNGEVSFNDQSINGATSWLWDFGDGNTSTAQNPTHIYQNEGSYTVTLTASNGFGSDAASFNNLIVVDRPDGPPATGALGCSAGSLSLSANGAGTLKWFDQPAGGAPLGTGSTFNTPVLSATTTYYVENEESAVTYTIGPADNTFGGGGNFNGTQHLTFDAFEAFTLRSVKVYAQGSGNRTIQLRDGNGNVLQSATINIPNGEQTVTLNFAVPTGNNYQLGALANSNLYRNNAGPSYPYTVAGVASITNSSAGSDFYYSFYDWEIETPGCTSDRTAVVAEIVEAPSAQSASRCGSGPVTLTASGSGTLNWYDAASGGNLINSGNSFTTPPLNATTSYFVESDLQPAPDHVGPASNNFGTGSNFNNVQSLLFDCYEQVTLSSVRVYAQGAGNRTVELRNSGGTVLQSATVNIPDGESVIPLNFTLPVGTDLQLGTSAGPNLYRNNSGPSYPYDLPGVLSITGSTAGTDYYYFFYDWVVQQEGCATARTEVIASINPNPTVSVSGDTEVCEGQSVQLTSSATDADSYSWSNGSSTTDISVSPTEETTYSLTVSNACGDATDEITVQVNPLPTISASADLEICEGETAQLSSTSNENVSWQPSGETTTGISVSPTQTTVYTVSATNNCGTASEDVEVTVNPLPTANAGADQTICEGETATLTATGGSNYQWDNAQTAASIQVTPGQNTTYSVQVVDANGCFDSDEVEVTVNTPPNQPVITDNGPALESSTGISYQWYLNGDPIENATMVNYEPTATGYYTVEVFDANGCSSISDPFSWITVGIGALSSSVAIYPNPFHSELIIELNEAANQVEVTDSRGKLIFSSNPNAPRFSIATDSWSSGVYTLKVRSGNESVNQKVVKAGQ